MLIKSSNVFSLNVRDLLYTLLTFTILLLFIWDDKSYLLIIFSVLSVLTFKITKIEFKFILLLLFYIALVTCYYLVRDSSEFVF